MKFTALIALTLLATLSACGKSPRDEFVAQCLSGVPNPTVADNKACECMGDGIKTKLDDEEFHTFNKLYGANKEHKKFDASSITVKMSSAVLSAGMSCVKMAN